MLDDSGGQMFQQVYFSSSGGDNPWVHDLVSLNGQITDTSSVQISALSVAALYGKGVFTTLAIYDEEPFVWEKHIRRLTVDSERLQIDISEFSGTTIRRALDELIARNRVRHGRARITFLDESPSEFWPAESSSRTSLLITTADLAPSSKNLKLGISPYAINSASPLAAVKSSNYLERIVSRAEARLAGTEESIQMNERDEIVSAIMANVFWVKGGKVFTPSLATGCLAGTTREFVLENLECKEVEARIGELASADDIFLTSAGIGVVQVGEFNDRRFQPRRHPITSLLPPI